MTMGRPRVNAATFIGQRFGELLILDDVTNGVRTRVRVRCSCGRSKEINLTAVTTGKTQSCGHLAWEHLPQRNTSHGHTIGGPTRTYNIWQHMLARCYNGGVDCYSRYGGRGIMVCPEWRASFETFLHDMGDAPSRTSLDRIDNNGHYSPDNCRWADAQTQGRNKRTNRMVEHEGQLKPLTEWCELLGLGKGRLTYHLNMGRSIKDVIAVPSRRQK